MKSKAYAKINLCLNVVGKREDGYHDLEMIMVPIDLFDTVDIEFADQMQISLNKSFLPIDERNTIVKAIAVLREEYGFTQQFNIRLMKNIPSQAGMAGGSTDAAITINILNEMLNLNMDVAKKIELGKKVGADVPFCILSEPAYVEGIGERLTPIEVNCPFHLFLVKPKKGVSTKKAFQALRYDELIHADCAVIIKALKENDYGLLVENLKNSLEQSAFHFVSQIKDLKEELIEYGFDGALMSGSGSTVFAITRNEDLVNKAVLDFGRKYPFVKKSKIVMGGKQ